jgi:hypothetical protein
MPSRLASFGDWLEQLVAESTGKEGKGILPVLNEPPAEVCAYGNDRVFVIFQNDENDNDQKAAELLAAGHPVITIKLDDNYDLGGQMFLWEMATAVATHILKINPFDQPNVEAAKKHAHQMIAQYKQKKELPLGKVALSTKQCDVYGNINGKTPAEALKNFLSGAAVNDYVCLQVYLSPAAEIDKALIELRQIILVKYGLAVTVGYGPRYLHSTGQLHKGDSGNGLFIQLTADDLIDVDIPDQIGKAESSLSFGVLKALQAQGDWQALLDAHRRVIRFHWKTNSSVGIKKLADLL